jgi:hypothetical protein
MDRRRRRAAPSYEEDMTPPRGMRGYRPEMSPAPEPPSYEEDMTPPPGMRGFNPRMEPAQESPRGPMRRMAKGGAVKKMAAGGSASKRADGCVSRGKTKGKFV